MILSRWSRMCTCHQYQLQSTWVLLFFRQQHLQLLVRLQMRLLQFLCLTNQTSMGSSMASKTAMTSNIVCKRTPESSTTMVPSGDLINVFIQYLAMQQSQKTPQMQASQLGSTRVNKTNFNVKAINSAKVKDCPVYILRNVDNKNLSSFSELIENRFWSGLILETHRLPIGYFKGSIKIS